MSEMKPKLRVCTHFRLGAVPSCDARGGSVLLEDLRRLMESGGGPWDVEPSLCLGHCPDGPNVKGAPGGPILNRCRDAQSVLDRMDRDWPNRAKL